MCPRTTRLATAATEAPSAVVARTATVVDDVGSAAADEHAAASQQRAEEPKHSCCFPSARAETAPSATPAHTCPPPGYRWPLSPSCGRRRSVESSATSLCSRKDIADNDRARRCREAGGSGTDAPCSASPPGGDRSR